MAIDFLVRARADLRSVEGYLEQQIAECKKIREENALLNSRVNELTSKLRKYEENEQRAANNSSGS